MDLLLWRHAEAEDGKDDTKRRLTGRGEKQAQAVAAWLREHGPEKLKILVSPATRAQQTVAALDLPFETINAIGPEARATDLLTASGWPGGTGRRHEAVMLVGHQPGLGQLAALLLAGEEALWTIKKGAVWWFTNRVRAGETQTVLQAVVGPDQAR